MRVSGVNLGIYSGLAVSAVRLYVYTQCEERKVLAVNLNDLNDL